MFRRIQSLTIRLTLLICVALAGSMSVGCATMAGERTQEIKVMTTPPGRIVKFEGVNVRDGEVIRLNKRSDVSVFEAVDPNAPELYPLEFKPSKWFLGDLALLLPGVIPGVIALGVDMYTGAWRDYKNPQTIQLGEAPPPEPMKRQMTTEEDESFKKKTGGSEGSSTSKKPSGSGAKKSSTTKKSEPAPETSPIEP